MRRLPGPQDHLGRAADRTATRHGADVAHWQEKNGARLWSEMQRELAEFEAGLGIPRGSFGRMIAWCDRLSRADFPRPAGLDDRDGAEQGVAVMKKNQDGHHGKSERGPETGGKQAP